MDVSGLNVRETDFVIVFERRTLPNQTEPEDVNVGQWNGSKCMDQATGYAESVIASPTKDHKWVKVTESEEPVPGHEVTWVLIDSDGITVAVVQWCRQAS